MSVEIISVGDELLTGMVVNTNAAHIAEKISTLGLEVSWISTVGDDAPAIIQALRAADSRAQVIIVTGGLGPTHDDVTKKAVCRFFNDRLVLNERILVEVEERLKRWNRPLGEANLEQAEVPEKAVLMTNEIGTAPGLAYTQGDRRFYILPGVPAEMKRMLERAVLPQLTSSAVGHYRRSRLLLTVGIPESDLFERLADVPDRYPGVKIAFLPRRTGVVIRCVTSCDLPETCEESLSRVEEAIREKAERYIFGIGETRLEEAVAELLFREKLTISIAESCTGGLVSHKLTNVPGSSAYFERCVVAYHNRVKVDLLGVPRDMLERCGAVSRETAIAMADGIRRLGGTDIGLSTTGIAGPGGGTPTKPVGLVYIGYSDKNRSFAEEHRFVRDRSWNKERSALTALDLVRRVLKKLV